MVETALHSTSVGEPGPTVVFLHGLFGQGRNFTQVARGLEPALRSVLVDLPDHGRSAWTQRVDYAVMADAVAEHVRHDADRVGDRVHVVGHSMGGKVAMTLALRHPDLVERLAVLDISPVAGGATGEFEHLLATLATLDLPGLRRRGEADALLADRIRSAAVRGFLLQNLRAVETGGWRWQANLDLLRRELAVIGGFPEHEGAPFDRPVLWMAGELSDYVRPEHEPLMRALFPRVRRLVVKGAGHWVHSERPEVVTAALRAFLAPEG